MSDEIASSSLSSQQQPSSFTFPAASAPSVPSAPIIHPDFQFGTPSPTASLQPATFTFSSPNAAQVPTLYPGAPPCTVTPSPTTYTVPVTGFFGLSTPAPAVAFQHGSSSVPPATGYTGATSLFGGNTDSTFVFGSKPLLSSGIGGHDAVCCGSTCNSPYQVTAALSETEYVYFESISAMESFNNWSHEELRFADYIQARSSTIRTRTPAYEVTHVKDGTAYICLQSISAMAIFKDRSHEELRYADYTQGNRGSTSQVPANVGRVGMPVSSKIEGVGLGVIPVSINTSGTTDRSSTLAEPIPVATAIENSSATQLTLSDTKNNGSNEVMKYGNPYVAVFGRASSDHPKITMNTKVIDTEIMLQLVCLRLVICSTVVPSVEVTLRCEGSLSKLFLILVATKEELYIFDCITLDAQIVCEALKPLLDHSGILKLIHDSHKTAALLKTFGNINEIQCIYDTQIPMEFITGKWNVGFSEMLDEFGVSTTHNTTNSFWKQNTPNALEQRPLPTRLQQFFLDDARKMHEAFEKHLTNLLDQSKFTSVLQASYERVRNATHTGGKRSLCFCSHDEYKMKSYECMQEFNPSQIIKPSPIVVLNDSEPLLGLLPQDIARWIRDRADDVFEIVLDKGRPPTAWIGHERVMIAGSDTTRIVTESDIQFVTTKLNKFGSDNRVGLEKQLHRISAIRNRNNDIIGLTMRVGRHVSGNAYIITDLLHCYPNSSILFLGEPGSGKTTVVREVTRLLAERHNVCIVDTSNEIAGDGDVPHPCVGHARRLMVQKSEAQSDVMIECVQNHTPDIIVIDEIGRSNEVDAARTCKNRGVRLIASAHGDLRQLVKNPKLRGLVGGIDRVIVGDEEARKRARNVYGKPIQKTKSERAGSPTFEIIVELKRGEHHEWTIILDSGDAVDKILDGCKYHVQRRTQNPKIGTFHLVHDEA